MSDVGFGENSTPAYLRIVDETRPDVIVLAGDYDEVEALISPLAASLTMFYEFLNYCSERSTVLAIRGNHETRGLSRTAYRYLPKKIDSTPGCHEVSNCGVVEKDGLSFLGVGYRSRLLPTVKRFADTRVDVVIAHCGRDRTDVFTRLSPKVIIHGHAASGPPEYKINQVPIVSTGVLRYVLIRFDGARLRGISHVVKQRTTFTTERGYRRFWF